MANVYTSLATSTTTITELSAALQTKYSTGVTIHFQDATNVIFSCPQVSDKVIRFRQMTNNNLYVYYADSWTSGTTLVNSVMFRGQDENYAISAQHLICGDSYVLLNTITTSDYTTGIALVGKLTNGNSIAVGLFSYMSISAADHYSKDLTLGENISLIGIDVAFTSDSGLLFKRPIYVSRLNVGLETNGDGSIATIPGLYSVSHVPGIFGASKSDTYFISGSNYYSGSYSVKFLCLRSSLLAEW